MYPGAPNGILSQSENNDLTRRIIDATLSIDPSLKMASTTTASLTSRSSLPLGLRIDTIILTSHDKLLLFLQNMSRVRPNHSSELGLVRPNHPLVRRFWATSGDINLPGMTSSNWIDFRELDVVLKNAEVLGIRNHSLQVLDYALERHDFDADPCMETWNARHAVFFGDSWRWNSLKNSQGGPIYLARLTHLTIWLEDNAGGRDGSNGLPSWVQAIPFHMMPSLIHFECPLDRHRSRPLTEMRVYTAQMPGTIHHWLLDPTRCPEHFRPTISTKLVSIEDVLQW